jgi:hypothetical protein
MSLLMQATAGGAVHFIAIFADRMARLEKEGAQNAGPPCPPKRGNKLTFAILLRNLQIEG